MAASYKRLSQLSWHEFTEWVLKRLDDELKQSVHHDDVPNDDDDDDNDERRKDWITLTSRSKHCGLEVVYQKISPKAVKIQLRNILSDHTMTKVRINCKTACYPYEHPIIQPGKTVSFICEVEKELHCVIEYRTVDDSFESYTLDPIKF
jgi:hypothetical protein